MITVQNRIYQLLSRASYGIFGELGLVLPNNNALRIGNDYKLEASFD